MNVKQEAIYHVFFSHDSNKEPLRLRFLFIENMNSLHRAQINDYLSDSLRTFYADEDWVRASIADLCVQRPIPNYAELSAFEDLAETLFGCQGVLW